METITEKLKLLNCPADMYQQACRHIWSLKDISLEELEKILRLLLTKKIIVPQNGKILVEPADFCVLANGFDVLNQRIEEMEKQGELDAYRQKLIRLNAKSVISRITAIKEMNEPYKNEEGKYSKVLFSYRLFKLKYPKKEVKEEIKRETPSSPQPVMKEPSKESIYDQIIQAPQQKSLNDESFGRFERLTDSARRVMIAVYGTGELNDGIIDNLIKLVSSDVMQNSPENTDFNLLFNAITYGKSLSPEEIERIQKSIDDELKYTDSNDIELGRAA